MNPKQIKREIAKVKEELRKLNDAVEAREDKSFSEDEQRSWDEGIGKVKSLESQLKRAEEKESLCLDVSEVAVGHDRAADEKFESFGSQLDAIMRSCTPGNSTDVRLERAASGQNETNPADGGFLVQTDFQTEIFKRMYDVGILARACRKTPIGENANGLAWNQVQETSRATGSRNGGVRGYWASEAGTVAASKQKYAKQKLDLEKLMGFMYATDELLQDTTALAAMLSEEMSEEFAWLLDEAILNGTGAGQPLGITNSDCFVAVAKETGQAANTIVVENIDKMWARIWARSMGRGSWYINQDAFPQLQSMARVVGTGGVPVYTPANGISDTPFSTLMGRPVIPIEQAKTVGTLGDIFFADFDQYRLIDKGGIKSDASIHVRFLYDEQAFRYTYRVNGQPLWTSALTPANGTSTISPFVGLASRD